MIAPVRQPFELGGSKMSSAGGAFTAFSYPFACRGFEAYPLQVLLRSTPRLPESLWCNSSDGDANLDYGSIHHVLPWR